MSTSACGSKPVSAIANATRIAFPDCAVTTGAWTSTAAASQSASIRIDGMADVYWRACLRHATVKPIAPMVSIVLYVLAIIVCGGLGALMGWAIAASLGLTGTAMALVAAFIGMVVATLLWIVGAALLPGKR